MVQPIGFLHGPALEGCNDGAHDPAATPQIHQATGLIVKATSSTFTLQRHRPEEWHDPCRLILILGYASSKKLQHSRPKREEN